MLCPFRSSHVRLLNLQISFSFSFLSPFVLPIFDLMFLFLSCIVCHFRLNGALEKTMDPKETHIMICEGWENEQVFEDLSGVKCFNSRSQESRDCRTPGIWGNQRRGPVGPTCGAEAFKRKGYLPSPNLFLTPREMKTK